MTRRPIAKLTAAAAVPIAAALIALLPQAALAHDGRAAESGRLGTVLTTWTFDAPGLALAVIAGGLYLWAYLRVRRDSPAFRFPAWHAACFGLGWFLLIIGLASPIDAYSDDLFWAHMLQHVLITMVIAPLMLLGAPATLALRAASPRVRRDYLVPLLDSRLLRFLTFPPIAVAVFILGIWLWHLPAAYDAAIASEALHFLEHAVFLLGATLFWWMIIGVDASRLRPAHVWRAALLVLAILQNIGLGLILTNIGEPAYDTYVQAAAAREWGPDALTDQRIGAGIMWVPGSMMFAIAVIATIYFWAEHEGFRGRRGDRVREMQRRIHGDDYFQPEIPGRSPDDA